ncbi:hypothetical protein CIHG_00215 [Coccidioides immitis H538.4]|uniref:Uncharacterized protein n=3 Tax=Coccidioides immitis TaxID=5501 RepID=A0A0J8QIC0_COCIT|nr:hypothetical protein CIRG_07035 [Coccidioides immitis RMSCC 2394]KMU72195.1 hypothetical protein CISG_00503 [Coccidioides immitis RMSCC 3703]KMU82433.1 hypothetical protein CIHG_00215 [Coccidioides immitis H538.4]
MAAVLHSDSNTGKETMGIQRREWECKAVNEERSLCLTSATRECVHRVGGRLCPRRSEGLYQGVIYGLTATRLRIAPPLPVTGLKTASSPARARKADLGDTVGGDYVLYWGSAGDARDGGLLVDDMTAFSEPCWEKRMSDSPGLMTRSVSCPTER